MRAAPAGLAVTVTVAGAVALFAGCAATGSGPGTDDVHRVTRSIDGHEVRITLRDADPERAAAAAEAAFARTERTLLLLDASREGGEIALLNLVPSHVWIAVSPETAQAVRRARWVAEASGGYYDPTLVPVLRVWGLGPDPQASKVPSLPEINHALRKVDWESVEVREDGSVRRTGRHLQLDLGPVRRGRALDAAADALREAGVPAAMVEIDQDRVAYGGTRERPWRVVLPAAGAAAERTGAGEGVTLRGGGISVVQVVGTPVGPERVLVHRWIDPWTGYPSRGVRLVAVSADDAGAACGLAAAIAAMGGEATAFADSRAPEAGFEAIVVLESGARLATPGMTLVPTDPAARETR